MVWCGVPCKLIECCGRVKTGLKWRRRWRRPKLEDLVRERAELGDLALCPRCGKAPPPGWGKHFDVTDVTEVVIEDFCTGGTR